MVLDEVWRGLDGVEVLSGPQGGPLRRTVKLILDPLVIRPVQHPLCAGPIVSAEGASELASRLNDAAPVLRATADWFRLLKGLRRSLRITEGHPQDLYFQRCFELATTLGRPDPEGSRPVAEDTLREVHEGTAGRTTRALRDHLTDPEQAAELESLLALAWSRRPANAVSGADFSGRLLGLVNACATARSTGGGAAEQRRFDDLVGDRAGTHSGIRLWGTEIAPTARHLGLTVHPVPHQPELGASASTATLGLPFDRSIYERVFTVLQSESDRSALPTVAELVEAEIARSSAPWALLTETLRVAAAAGTTLAQGFRPLGVDHGAGSDDESVAQQVINGRWRREAYVLQARRLAIRDTDEPTGPLAVIAAELREPWRPYLRRLWVRLHGRDARELDLYDATDLWDLLDGVARSVILDHRGRVKQALSVSIPPDRGEAA
ncbi:hypothetical protein [Nocardia stercoris]|uniref:Uncharacterized protein n=1 Tax=Nocardia stercoris TaxID=2483361 RepID=A0A3M2L8V0_9NOCA|nr:hypothetical protein [Nocardia stercoris]RMI33997.1 hypothetical protein EBN03_05955 [Nocardia stercoris]